MQKTLDRLDELGIVSFMDVDDYWSPGTHHPAHMMIKQSGLDKKIENNVRLAKNVITTTPIFAKEISKLNKNVFVLPNAIDPSEKQFTPKPEKSDRIRIAWLGGSCMTPDTEILTNEGWKRFDELNQSESVATLNPDTNELEYHYPTGYICEPFEGELNCATNGLIEYEVTPNHNMYASVSEKIERKILNLNLIQSKELHGSNFHVKRDAVWTGERKEYMLIPAMIGERELVTDTAYRENSVLRETRYYNSMAEKYCTDKYLDMDKWLQFFGFWLAEGWISKTDGLYQVGVAQTKDNDYLETIFNILTDLGYSPTYTKDRGQIRVFDRQLWSYLSQFGTATEKYIPNELLDLSAEQLNILLTWFIKGDGHVEKNKYTRTRAWTSSKRLADNLQEIALKIGITATVTNRGKKTTSIKGRVIISQHDSHQVNFGKHPNVSKHNKANPLVRSEHQFNKYYKGNVYCVEVKNHIIYVRRNGKAFWIGNSHVEDLKLLKGIVNKIKADGLLDKVQFVLCGYDIRGAVTTIDQRTGQQTQRPIKPHESVWYEYEKIFTDDFKIISPEYKNYLHTFNKDEYEDIANEPYRRVWTKPITTYASNYNLFDVSLAPLVEHKFNAVKSQLKVIEAGFHKKALIAQDFGPYTLDLKNAKMYGGGFDETGNALLVDSSKNHKQWYQHIKYLIENPDKIEILAKNLHDTVTKSYHIDVVTEARRDLYLKLLKEKEESSLVVA
jgi:intein/homing endonuclease